MIDFNYKAINKIQVIADDFVPDSSIPKVNSYKPEIIIGRTDYLQIPKTQWEQISDGLDNYTRKNFIKSYFSLAVYVLKRNSSKTLVANQSYRENVELSHTSSYRNTQNQNLRIENVLSATGNAEFGSISETLSLSYGIDKMDEYFSEDRKTTMEEVYYDSTPKERTIVFWDFIKIVLFYRTDTRENTKLVAYNDFYIETYQKAYIAASS